MEQKGLAPILIIILIAAVLGVGGYILYKQQAKPTSLPQNPTLSSQAPQPTSSTTPESTSSAETANWKTYKNDVDGYLFQYPSNISTEVKCIRYDNKSINIKEPGGKRIPILSECFIKDKINMFRVETYPPNSSSFMIYEPESDTIFKVIKDDILIANIKATRYTRIPLPNKEAGWNTQVYVSLRGKTYIISVAGEEHKEIFNQILSTFKFIP